jgi:nucleotide-binding universal stress UspA family protein
MHELSDVAGLAPYAARLLACRGEALSQILEHEHGPDCDLIIMSRQGEVPLLEQVFLGSVTKQVLARSRADVLVCTGE